MEIRTIRLTGFYTGLMLSAGIWLFAWFINRYIAIGIAGLLIASVAVSLNVKDVSQLLRIAGLTRINRHFIKSLLFCIIAGVALSLYVNSYKGVHFIPQALTSVAIIASCIGLTEELIFRGYLQGVFSERTGILAPVLSSASHSIYKVLIFWSFPVTLDVNLFYLGLFTFLVGLLAGWARKYSGSVIPSAAGHMLFDIIVYGTLTSAPVWVWG